jgi:hypothetical protein
MQKMRLKISEKWSQDGLSLFVSTVSTVGEAQARVTARLFA